MFLQVSKSHIDGIMSPSTYQVLVMTYLSESTHSCFNELVVLLGKRFGSLVMMILYLVVVVVDILI